mgnify:CR=1 FL=1
MSATRRGGIPGPESRTGLVRPAMTEAEFERRMAAAEAMATPQTSVSEVDGDDRRTTSSDSGPELDPPSKPGASSSSGGSSRSKSRGRGAAKIRRVQRMFAIEEELDKKLWLYAIHVGKDRSEVVNDLLRPLVGSMVLYDSRDLRSSRQVDTDPEN